MAASVNYPNEDDFNIYINQIILVWEIRQLANI